MLEESAEEVEGRTYGGMISGVEQQSEQLTGCTQTGKTRNTLCICPGEAHRHMVSLNRTGARAATFLSIIFSRPHMF